MLYDGARPHGIQWLSDDTAVVTAEGMEALLIVDVAQRRVTETVAIAQQGGHMVSASAAMNMQSNVWSWFSKMGSLPLPFQGGIAPQWNTPVTPIAIHIGVRVSRFARRALSQIIVIESIRAEETVT